MQCDECDLLKFVKKRIKSAQSSERRREQNYGGRAYRAHRAVIFAMAQLSC